MDAIPLGRPATPLEGPNQTHISFHRIDDGRERSKIIVRTWADGNWELYELAVCGTSPREAVPVANRTSPLTKENKRKLPLLRSTDEQGGDAVALVKLFTPDSSWA